MLKRRATVSCLEAAEPPGSIQPELHSEGIATKATHPTSTCVVDAQHRQKFEQLAEVSGVLEQQRDGAAGERGRR